MTAIGRLIDADPRAAWRHEAIDFTPWLAQNLDQLGEVIGRELEAEGTEIRVGAFSADILARDIDGDLVLIENQLEGTDHSHLGQIMTYLAGLEAKTVVWIATGFREEHLAAINWLNEHTVDPFAFFAIRLRVVRIGDSAPAPIFDVVARPNAWERRLQKVAREADGEISEIGRFRRAFWTRYLERHPQDADHGVGATATSSVWLLCPKPNELLVALYISKKGVGLFVRGGFGEGSADVQARLAPAMDRFLALAGEGLSRGDDKHHPGEARTMDMTDRACWDAQIDWLHARAHAVRAALIEIFGEER